ncbi:MAG: hypothetical protein KKE23_00840 [Nanoarchaeota archaeon]|nr:hypothetical protein [Nanoarchaeota archaeon]
MREIIQKLLAAHDSKERTRLLEEFRNFQLKGGRAKAELITFEVFKEAKQLLETTEDNGEKIVSLRVLGAIYLIYPFNLMAEMFGIKNIETLVKDEEILEILDICLELLESDDGNLRLSSAHLINHLRGHLSDYNSVDLFYNLLSLRNSPKNQGKNKKTIGFCLDKIYSPFLEASLDASCPPEARKMKMNIRSKNTETINTAKSIGALANQMISETEKSIQKILSLRGEYLLEKNFIPYIENLGMLQIFYEIQKLRELSFDKKISQEFMKNYMEIRILPLAKGRIEMLDGLPEKEEFSLVILNANGNLKIMNLQEAYDLLLKTSSSIESF